MQAADGHILSAQAQEDRWTNSEHHLRVRVWGLPLYGGSVSLASYFLGVPAIWGFFKINAYWSVITLQCCVCCTMTRISRMYTQTPTFLDYLSIRSPWSTEEMSLSFTVSSH